VQQRCDIECLQALPDTYEGLAGLSSGAEQLAEIWLGIIAVQGTLLLGIFQCRQCTHCPIKRIAPPPQISCPNIEQALAYDASAGWQMDFLNRLNTLRIFWAVASFVIT
jgi:hypothetical protein